MPALGDSLSLLFSELLDGPKAECYMLNMGDVGLLKSLDTLSAPAASAIPPAGGASIAAHVDHLVYGLHLMNRYVAGDPDPWSSADWAVSWKQTSVTEKEWAALRDRLRSEARRWRDALSRARDLEGVELNGAIASIAHLAYHHGAIRQIDRSIRGPSAEQAASGQ
jgi:uncharacterized damage-inducible protein DinB